MSNEFSAITDHLEKNLAVFRGLLSDPPKDFIRWRPAKGKWNLLEIVCHLLDEECEDFRARIRWTLERPGTDPPPIDPERWVIKRNYNDRSYLEMTSKFLEERQCSVNWLRTLEDAPWNNAYEHPLLGPMQARMLLANWLAHDLLHLRQVLYNQYQYLRCVSGEDLSYAGSW